VAFKLSFSTEAKDQLDGLTGDAKKLKRVKRCLGLISANPKHPGLRSHKYLAMKTEDRRDMWQSYVENNTPAAWRVFWYYGPESDRITIVAITAHP